MLNGTSFEACVRNGWRNLLRQETIINDLNVFPVADGDTGTNMRLTAENGVKNAASTDHIGEYTAKLATGMLLGARGNSGVIFSQIFKGISLSLKGKRAVDAKDLADALVKGYEVAYAAVIHPTEGTILTVAREGIEKTRSTITQDTTVEELLQRYLAQMKETLSHTPEMLDVLRRAGVVDSGGMGLVSFFEGFVNHQDAPVQDVGHSHFPAFSAPLPQEEDESFGYCTEFILRLNQGGSFDTKEAVTYLETLGLSLVAVRDEDLLKIHIHTEQPLEVLTYAQSLGTFLNVKIENLTDMVQEQAAKNQPRLRFAYVAVAQGDGIIQTMRDLGCNVVINGGQTMNTSAEEFLTVLRRLNAEHIIVLPNNPNIIAAARQAKELSGLENVHIIPTKTIVEGYFAMSMAAGNDADLPRLLSSMEAGMDGVASVLISRAVRDSDGFGIPCSIGDYLGIHNGSIVCAGSRITEVVPDALEKLENLELKEFVVLFRGQALDEDACDCVLDAIAERFPWLEISVIDGGQDVYDLIIGLIGSED